MYLQVNRLSFTRSNEDTVLYILALEFFPQARRDADFMVLLLQVHGRCRFYLLTREFFYSRYKEDRGFLMSKEDLDFNVSYSVFYLGP